MYISNIYGFEWTSVCLWCNMYLKGAQSSASRYMRKSLHNRQRRETMLGLKLMQLGIRSHIKGYNFFAKNLLTELKSFSTSSKWLKVRLNEILVYRAGFTRWHRQQMIPRYRRLRVIMASSPMLELQTYLFLWYLVDFCWVQRFCWIQLYMLDTKYLYKKTDKVCCIIEPRGNICYGPSTA